MQIAGREIGPGHPCFIVAELGINANGDVALAREIIDVAHAAGCNAIKFQKRTVDVVYSVKELAKPRESPFGTTNGDQKRALEFGSLEYDLINDHCADLHFPWFASCWDEESVDFIARYDPPAFKIASPSLTDDDLLRHTRGMGKPIVLSTGMSTDKQIDQAVEVLGTRNLILLHCTSTYPFDAKEANLRCMETLRNRYDVPVGFSDHSPGIPAPVIAATLGACMIEKHITKSRVLYGSDQAASMEPVGLKKMVDYIRYVERAMGDGVKRVYDSEVPIMAKLRRKPGVIEFPCRDGA